MPGRVLRPRKARVKLKAACCERWREFWRASEAELGPSGRLSAKEILGIFMSAFALYAVFTPRGLPNGDAAVYAQQVLAGDFASRPVHLGYYLLAAFFSLGQPVPDRFFNLLSEPLRGGHPGGGPGARPPLSARLPAGLGGAAGARRPDALPRKRGARRGAPPRRPSPARWLLYAWLRDQAPAAGFCFGVAGLLTPSSVFRAGLPAAAGGRAPARSPCWRRSPGPPCWRRSCRSGASISTATAASRRPAKASSLLQLFRKEGIELAGYLAFLPLLALGVCRPPAGRRRGRCWPLVAAVWAATLLGEKFGDVPVQLPTWALAAVFAALGAAELAEEARAALGRDARARKPVGVVGAACLVHRRVAALAGAGENRRIEDYRRQALALGAAAAPDYLAIGSWERGILLEHYLYRRSYTEHFLNTAWLAGGWGVASGRLAPKPTSQRRSHGGRQVWLLGRRCRR